ncbi:MAG: hypothetical protein HN737_01785 [Desulfobacterales bacterium]|nr:hypothetical protein [Desulfobacteraceae bacterium]MBT7696121.1 hypothetical protein [Desulfobacterales bacterium]
MDYDFTGNNGPTRTVASKDEFTHVVEEVVNYNESMYINAFDHTQNIGGWFRVGNRPNEHHAEVSVCLYLPDGKVGFIYARPEIADNSELVAAGLSFKVVDPLKHIQVTYEGKICLLNDPEDMQDPKKAFSENPMVDCFVDIEFHGLHPVVGGEVVAEDGGPVPPELYNGFFRGHYEQHMRATGSIVVDNMKFLFNGYGLRDHSWGPRYWQNMRWYRWFPICFGEDFGIACIMQQMDISSDVNYFGYIHEGDRLKKIVEAKIKTEYDKSLYCRKVNLSMKADDGTEYKMEGKILSLIPLRNRRTTDEGDVLETRIIEAMIEFHYNGMRGVGMAEYLDFIEDGQPAGNIFELTM